MTIFRNIASLIFVCLVTGIPLIGQDSLFISADTIVPVNNTGSKEKFAENTIESEIIFGALDSQVYDHVHELIHLHGKAYVEYEDKKLNADYIILDLKNNYADARKVPFNPLSEKPTFNDGQKEYTYNRLKYNFKTEKGIVFDAITTEGEFLIHGEKTKYVSAESNEFSDDNAVYNSNALITTCAHDDPHFGFRAKRLKVIPEKVAVIGPSNLEIGGIPTPLWVPFGFYPLTEGKSSGFIFPQDYEFNSANKGFGLRGIGWYFPINDYVHVRLTADIYSRGSFALYTNTQYKKKYKYNGSLYLSFDNTITEDVETAQKLSRKGFTVRLQHRQEAKAHPYIDIGGSINIVGNNNQARVFNDAQSVLTSTYTSNFYYRHSMPRTPFSFSLGLDHNQNTSTQKVNITLPDIKLNMNTIYPFQQRNKGSNKEKWFEKISFDYDMKMKSFVTTTDTTMFTAEMYDDIKTGMNHDFSTSLSTRVLKYFNLVPRADYEETWVLNTLDKRAEVIEDPDTGEKSNNIEEENLTGFDRFYKYSAGISLNTQIFGTKTFSKGWLRGIRHTMKPDIGFSYAPDTRSIYTDTLYLLNDRIEQYTRFDGGPFGSPSFSNLSSLMTYRLTNVLEIKYFSRKDSTEKKLKLFDNINISGNYNFAADSLKWSRVSMSSTSRFFKGITTIATSWTFDPYIEQNNRAVDISVWSQNKKPVRLERGTIRLSNRLKVSQIRDIFGKKSEESTSSREISGSRSSTGQRPGSAGSSQRNSDRKPKGEELIGLMDLFDNLSVNHELKYDITANDEVREGRISTHSLTITGSLPLTDNWTVSIGNLGYDFVKKGLSYTAVTFTRKLHCWNMNFSWYPNRDTYSFFIGVNSTNLSFLRYNYGQNNVDGLFNALR